MATGISVSGTSNFSTGQKIMVAAAMVAFEPSAPNPDLVDNKRIPVGHKQWDEVLYGRLSQASALTEGVDLSQVEQLVSTTTSITPTEHGIICTLSKRLIRRQGDSDIVSTAGRQIADSLRRRMDNDVIALYDTISKSSPGTGNPMDITFVRAAVAYLLTDNDPNYGPAPMPLHAALHIEQISDIVEQLTDASPRGTTTGFTDDLIRRWWKGRDRLYGVDIFHAGNIAKVSGTQDAKGAIFSPQFAVLCMANEADVTEEPDKSARIVEYGIFQEWGEAERADVWGVEIFSDCTTGLT